MQFSTSNLVFKLVSLIVRSLTSLNKIDVEFGKVDSSKLIVYALATESVIDLATLNEICKQNNLPLPIQNLRGSSIKSFVSLKQPKYSVLDEKFIRQKASNLEEILRVKQDILIVPVSIFWGQRPDKEQSFFKKIFSPSWRPAGSLKRIFKLIVHGRNIRFQFENHLDLSQELDWNNSTEKNGYILTRYLRAVFRKSKLAILGPDISHRRTLVKSLIRKKIVREEIKKISEGSKKRKNQLTKKAYKYANEICSDLNYPIISVLISGFTWFWNTRYEGLHTQNLDKIRETSKENALIFLPCHRSHIDYCALSYLLYVNGLMVPQVAAGNNLNLPIIGGILRGAGAVFMRRSFMSNPLYSVVFFEHIRTLMTRGNSIEFFPEGGRSRTGLSLPSRPGLLSLVIRSFASLRNQNVKIVPIYIGYEKILEGQSYLSELSGGNKKRESILDPLKVFKDFRNYLGNAYLNFSDPIDLDEFLKSQTENYLIDSPQEKPQWVDKATSDLGQTVIRSINNSVAVTPTSLFSLALLTDATQTLSQEDLENRIEFFMGLINQSQDYKDVWITENNVKKIIEKTEKLGFISPALVATKKIYRPTSEEVATLSFYKNNISHLFILYSLLCESVKFTKFLTRDELIKLLEMIYPIFSREFHLKLETVDAVSIDKALEALVKVGVLKLDDQNRITHPSENHPNYDVYLALTNLCEPVLKRFYIVMSTVWKEEQINKDLLKSKCKKIAEDIEAKEGWPYPEFSDKAKFDNFVYMMKESKFFREDENGNLTASKITRRAQQSYELFFDKEFIQLVENQAT